MKVSVFTPTHNPAHLEDAARSLAAQTLKGEWIVGLNGGASRRDVLAGMSHAEGWTIRVESLSDGGIGALKRALCEMASGDLLVELDHDDLLHPEAIERVAVAVDGGAGFVYSDFAEFDDKTLGPLAYSSDFGWAAYDVRAQAPGTRLDGAPLLAMRAFSPTARAFAQILYAPNHLRAWTREAYERAGGHSPRLAVCDDHDLLCRTFIAGVECHHIPEALYYYRRGAPTGNSFVEFNRQIQTLSGQGAALYPEGSPMPDFAQPITLRDQYLHGLVEAEARRCGGVMLDIGGGIDCPPGWTSVDIHGGTIRRDVRDGLPYQDGDVFAIRAFDVLEHLDPGEAAKFIAECWRALCHGGWLLTRTPADHGVGAACDLSHRSRWNTRTWAYFWSGALRPYREQAFPCLGADFAPVRIFEETVVMGPPPCRWDVPYVVADLQALKGGERLPGAVFV